jgi:Asp-tRNA(Asn)/Glu-tRNA(Gln) amidotransferase B subunit
MLLVFMRKPIVQCCQLGDSRTNEGVLRAADANVSWEPRKVTSHSAAVCSKPLDAVQALLITDLITKIAA